MVSAQEHPDNLRQRYRQLKDLGDCYAAMADTAKARQCYQHAAELMPAVPDAHLALGQAALQDGDLDCARVAFEAARRHRPECSEAWMGLAQVCQRRRDHVAAFDLYLKCLDLNGDNLMALLGLFQASRQMGTFAKIISYLEIYLARHPKDSAVLFCLASLYAREGRLEAAKSAVLAVLRAEPSKFEALSLLNQIEQSLSAATAGACGARA